MDLQNRLEEQILHDTYERIIMLLLRLCKSNGIKEQNGYKIATHFTNRDLANMIGTSRETMNRTINHLRKNWLRWTRTAIFSFMQTNWNKKSTKKDRTCTTMPMPDFLYSLSHSIQFFITR